MRTSSIPISRLPGRRTRSPRRRETRASPELWPGVEGTGLSKLPALSILLGEALGRRRNRFCPLIAQIVRAGLRYRAKKGNPVTAQDVESLNAAVAKVGSKIPELWDPKFLASLPGASSPKVPANNVEQHGVRPPQPDDGGVLAELRAEFLGLHSLRDRQEAGLRLEGLLTRLFKVSGLEPNGPFRVVGEQIDGSFDLDREVYLLEVKWTAERIGEGALLTLRGKIEGKSQFTRGLFLSINGYTPDSIEAITRGKSPNFVMADGAHLFRVLEGQIRLDVLLRRLVRHLAETGAPYLEPSRL